MNIKINGIDNDIVRRLDALAKKKRLSRNQLMIQVLTSYCVYGDTFFMKSIPDTVRFSLRETVQEEKEKESAMLSAVLDIQKETVQTLRELIAVFGLDSSETTDF